MEAVEGGRACSMAVATAGKLELGHESCTDRSSQPGSKSGLCASAQATAAASQQHAQAVSCGADPAYEKIACNSVKWGYPVPCGSQNHHSSDI